MCMYVCVFVTYAFMRSFCVGLFCRASLKVCIFINAECRLFLFETFLSYYVIIIILLSLFYYCYYYHYYCYCCGYHYHYYYHYYYYYYFYYYYYYFMLMKT